MYEWRILRSTCDRAHSNSNDFIRNGSMQTHNKSQPFGVLINKGLIKFHDVFKWSVEQKTTFDTTTF